MGNKVVSNTGPLLHLSEIDFINAIDSFGVIYIPQEVNEELIKNNIGVGLLKKVKIINLQAKFKDVAQILTHKFSLDLGESEAIALALQEKADYFLTDDLEARTVANVHGLEAHGTIGIILRALSKKLIDKDMAIKRINDIHSKSSLFITSDLIKQVIESIKEFK